MDGHASFADPGPPFGFAAGTLDAGTTHGRGCSRALFLITPGGGKEPGLVAMGFPVGSQQSEGLFGQGDVAVFGTLSSVDMDLEVEGFMEPESQAVDGGEVDLVVQG